MPPPYSKEQLEQPLFPILLGQSTGGTLVVDFHSGNVLRANENACETLGYTEEEIQQLRVPDIQVGVAFKSRMEWQAFAEKIKSNSEQGTLIRGRIQRKNGSTFPSQTLVSYGTHGGNEVLFAHFDDISSVVRLEGKLFDMPERFRLSFEHAPIPIAIISISKTFLQVNPAFCNMFGYTEKELIDQSYDFTMQEDDKTTFTDDCRLKSIEKRYNHKSGKIIPLNLIINPIKNDNEKLQYYIMQVIDLSEKIKMEKQLLQAHLQSRALAKKLLLIQEEERKRIAKELHDSLGQMLMAQKLIVNSLPSAKVADSNKKLSDLKSLIDESIAAVRHVATELHSTILDDLGLVDAIENAVEKLNQRSAITFSFGANPVPNRLSDKVKSAYFRVFQEATTNILRHSEASCANISLEITQQELIMKIQDNGKGVLCSKFNTLKSLGVLSMKERLSAINGSLCIGNRTDDTGVEVKAMVTLDFAGNIF